MARSGSKWLSPWAALAACLLAAPAARGQAFVVVSRSADELLADVRYLGPLAGEPLAAAVVEVLIINHGVDRKRPLGVYMDWPPGGHTVDSAADATVAVVPVVDEKGFLAGLGGKASRDGPDLHRVVQQDKSTAFVRFARGYAYVAPSAAPLRARLPDPAAWLPPGDETTRLFASFRMDEVPEPARKLMAKQINPEIDDFLTELYGGEQQAGESDWRYQTRKAHLKRDREVLGGLIHETGTLTFRVSLDRKRHHMAAELALVPRPGSRLAGAVKAFGAGRTRLGSLFDSPYASLNVRVPLGLEWPLVQTLLEDLAIYTNRHERAQMQRLVRALEPTLGMGVVELSVGLGKVPMLAVRIKDGRKLENLVRDMVKDLPAVERGHFPIHWSAVTHAGARIHKINLPPFAAAGGLRRSGIVDMVTVPTFYVAIRDDVFLAALDNPGADGLRKALDRLLDRPGPPAPAPVRLEVNERAVKFGAWMVLMGTTTQDAKKTLGLVGSLEKALKTKAGDPPLRASLTLHGDDALHLRLEGSTRLLRVVAVLRQGLGK